LFYLAQEILSKQEDVQVCLGARTKKDLLLASAFEDAGILTRLTTDDGSAGEKGLVSVAVLDAINDFSPNTIYACGPIPMLIALAQICREKSINYQLSWEALIRCGMGLCGSCELDPEVCQQAGVPQGWLTCKDGPVFHKIYKP
jgi:dihydroorotate dehydrogenase electron transfer subunit